MASGEAPIETIQLTTDVALGQAVQELERQLGGVQLARALARPAGALPDRRRPRCVGGSVFRRR